MPGDGEILYALTPNEARGGLREVAVVVRFDRDRELALSGQALPHLLQYRTQVSGIRLDCADGTSRETKSEYYDSENNLVYLSSQRMALNDIQAAESLAGLRGAVCDGK
jgi:hypothetical protein